MVVIGSNTIRVLKFMNLHNETQLTVYKIFKASLVLAFYHIVTVGMWGHLFFCINKYRSGEWKFRLQDIGDDAVGIMSSYLAFYFEIVYIVRCPWFTKIIKEAANFEHYEKPEGFDSQMTVLNKWAGYLIKFLYVSLVAAMSLTLMEKCEDGVVDDCGLLITAYMPFDLFYTPMRQIFCILQYLSAFNSAIATACICLPLIFVNHSIVLQTRQLQSILRRIPKMKTRAERKGLVKKCVLYHYRILGMTEELSDSAEPLYFTLVFLASFNISLTSYQFLGIQKKFVTAIHCILYLVCTGIACLFGETVIEEGGHLYNTIYDSLPLDGDLITTKDLYIMLMMASNNLNVSAGKFGPVGHIRFMEMMKGTYSFLTLFLNV